MKVYALVYYGDYEGEIVGVYSTPVKAESYRQTMIRETGIQTRIEEITLDSYPIPLSRSSNCAKIRAFCCCTPVRSRTLKSDWLNWVR